MPKRYIYDLMAGARDVPCGGNLPPEDCPGLLNEEVPLGKYEGVKIADWRPTINYISAPCYKCGSNIPVREME